MTDIEQPAVPRLLLIDGHSMAYRAFFSLPAENFWAAGQPTNAVFGFTSMLISLLSTEEPTHVGVAFDVSRTTFRTAIYGEYKATRSATPEEFKGQIPLIKEVLDALRIRHAEKPDFEADDILATWSAQAQAAGMEVLVCSGDRDSFQLIGPDVTVLYPKRGVSELSRMTPDAVRDKYGVGPDRYPDLAALVGEKSDNLPGVDGVGPKTAAKWINRYGDLAGIAEHAAELPGKAGESLRAALDQVLLNRRLGQLLRDLELPLAPEDLRLTGIDREEMHRVFDLLQFKALRERLLASDFGRKGELADDAGTRLASAAAPAAPRRADLPPGALAGWLGEHGGAVLGVDVRGSLTRGEGVAWALALADPSGEAVDLDLVSISQEDESALAGWLKSGRKAMAESKSAWHMLRGRGLDLGPVEFDTTLAAYLCFPDQRSYDLDDLSVRLLGRPAGPAEGMLDLDDDADIGRAAAVAQLVDPLGRLLTERGAAELLQRIELPLTPVLERMEAAGIAIDAGLLESIGTELDAQVAAARAEAIDAIGGQDVNLGSPKQLQEILFDQLGMKPVRRTKTGYSTDAESLAELFARTEHPFLEHLLAHRDAIKLRQTVEGLVKSIGDDGRIHTTFQQAVAATGRLSSADPNLQNIPVRTPAGRRIRSAFTVGAGYETLLTADYSQIEMRIMAHLSGDQGLIEAFRSGEDLHSYVAGSVFGVAPGEVSGEQRSRIKAMSYGLAYGLSAYGLARQLGIPPAEAGALRDEYFGRFGGIRAYLGGVVEAARRTGYTETILGRRRYLPELNSDRRQARDMAERMALNAPIQGSAADIMKVAMLGVDRALRDGMGSRVLLQVHDELVVEVAPGEAGQVEEVVRREMGSAAALSVPLEVSVGCGRDWNTAAH
ncbi:MAG: DNA polymerase I [Bifidobacteriaceae bacterium]|nr:DNA polymerase I [Bifidobacteriaceae bacterium]